MRKISLLLLLLFAIQNYSQHLNCGVSDENPQVEMQRRQLLSQLKSMPRATLPNETTYIPVKMHLFGLDNSTGYASSTEVNDALADLNNQFKPINIEFYFTASFSYYPNSLFYLGNQSVLQANDFHNANAVNNAMNFYVASIVKTSAGVVVGGWSFVTPTSQTANRLWTNIAQMNNNETTPHEFGHYFGLQHTFNNSVSTIVSDRELVTRNVAEIFPRLSANCLDAGDYLCDTPSDPHNTSDAIGFCSYSGTVTDVNSDLFSPDISNYMNYYNCLPNNFTIGQYARMSDSLLIISSADDFTLDAPETMQNAPTSLTASAGSNPYSHNVQLSWTGNSNVETGNIIERSNSASGPFAAIGGVGTNIHSYIHLIPEPGTPYYFRVKPSNSKNNYSNISKLLLIMHFAAIIPVKIAGRIFTVLRYALKHLP